MELHYNVNNGVSNYRPLTAEQLKEFSARFKVIEHFAALKFFDLTPECLGLINLRDTEKELFRNGIVVKYSRTHRHEFEGHWATILHDVSQQKGFKTHRQSFILHVVEYNLDHYEQLWLINLLPAEIALVTKNHPKGSFSLASNGYTVPLFAHGRKSAEEENKDIMDRVQEVIESLEVMENLGKGEKTRTEAKRAEHKKRDEDKNQAEEKKRAEKQRTSEKKRDEKKHVEEEKRAADEDSHADNAAPTDTSVPTGILKTFHLPTLVAAHAKTSVITGKSGPPGRVNVKTKKIRSAKKLKEGCANDPAADPSGSGKLGAKKKKSGPPWMVLPKQEIKKQILDEVFWHRIHQAHPLVLDATHRFVPWNEDIFARLDRPAIPPKPQPAGDSFRLHAPTDEEMAAYKASPKLTWGEHYALGYPTDPAIVETFYEIPEQVDVADGFIRWDYNGEGVRPIHGGLHHERCGCEDKTDPEVVPVSEPEPEPVRHVRSDSCSSTDSMSSIDSNGFPLRSVYGRLRPGEVRVPVPDYDAARSAASSGQGDSGQGGS